MTVDKESWALWKMHPITQKVLTHWERRRQQEVERLISYLAGSDTSDGIVRSTKIVGVIMGINELLEMSPEDMEVR